MVQVLLNRGACGGAVIAAVPIERQQAAHLIQRHIHGPAQADKAQLVDIGIAVQAVAAGAARAGAEQLFFLVIADIGRRHARACSGFANLVNTGGNSSNGHGLTFK